jgi:WD40 repeat protein
MSGNRQLTVRIAVACLVAGVAACGGQAEGSPSGARSDPYAPIGDEPTNPAAEPPSDPNYSAGGSQAAPAYPSAAQNDVCGAAPSSPKTELIWERGVPLYGIDPTPYFAFSGDGSKLITPSDQYGQDGNHIFAVADGAEQPKSPARVLGRDVAWSRELRGADLFASPSAAGSISVVDIALDEPLLALGAVSGLVGLSADGQYVFGAYCQGADPGATGGDRLERRRVSDGQVTLLPLSADVSPCTRHYYINEYSGYDDVRAAFAISGSNDAVAFPGSYVNQLVVASFSAGTASAHTIYPAPADGATLSTKDQVVTVALSPTEHALASVSGGGTLRVWSYPALVQSLPDIRLGVTQAFRDCYCAPQDFTPVAWSPDGRYLATADEAGNTVLRRACDGSIVTTLQAPKPAFFLEGYAQGPAFLAFSPNGRALAVLTISNGYDGVVSYYTISE